MAILDRFRGLGLVSRIPVQGRSVPQAGRLTPRDLPLSDHYCYSLNISAQIASQTEVKLTMMMIGIVSTAHLFSFVCLPLSSPAWPPIALRRRQGKLIPRIVKIAGRPGGRLERKDHLRVAPSDDSVSSVSETRKNELNGGDRLTNRKVGGQRK